MPWKDAPDEEHTVIIEIGDYRKSKGQPYKVELLLESISGTFEDKPLWATVDQAYEDCQAYVEDEQSGEKHNFFLAWIVEDSARSVVMEDVVKHVHSDKVYNGFELVREHRPGLIGGNNYLIEWVQKHKKHQKLMPAIAASAGKSLKELFPMYVEPTNKQQQTQTAAKAPFKCEHDHSILEAGEYTSIDNPYYLRESLKFHGLHCRVCKGDIETARGKITATNPFWICANYNLDKSVCSDGAVCNNCFAEANRSHDNTQSRNSRKRKRQPASSSSACTVL